MRPPLFLAVASVALAATACAAPLVVDPAPYAGDAGCAAIMLGIPDEVGGLTLRATSSQATAAYGKDSPIIVRCGVDVPGPSSERCVAIDTPAASADWLVLENSDTWQAISFGVNPATEVLIPKIRVDKAVSEILADFSPATSLAAPTGLECR